jgi:hypothetical protein
MEAMKEDFVYVELPEEPDDKTTRGIALGIFDGFHIGHQALLSELKHVCHKKGLRVTVFTFSFPKSVSFGGRDLHHTELMNDRERVRALKAFGVDDIFMIPMTDRITTISPEKFLESVVIKRLGGVVLAIGEDAHFGYRGAGDAAFLQSFATSHPLEAVVVPDVFWGGSKVSSSRIRALIASGDVKTATTLMTRPFRLFCDIESTAVLPSQKVADTCLSSNAYQTNVACQSSDIYQKSDACQSAVACQSYDGHHSSCACMASDASADAVKHTVLPSSGETDGTEDVIFQCPYPERSIVLSRGVYKTRVLFPEDDTGVQALSEVLMLPNATTGRYGLTLVSRITQSHANLAEGKSVVIEVLERI